MYQEVPQAKGTKPEHIGNEAGTRRPVNSCDVVLVEPRLVVFKYFKGLLGGKDFICSG